MKKQSIFIPFLTCFMRAFRQSISRIKNKKFNNGYFFITYGNFDIRNVTGNISQ